MDTASILFIVIVLFSVGVIIYTIKTKQVTSANIIPMILVPITLFTAYFTYYSKQVDEKKMAFEVTNRLNTELYDKLMLHYPYSINLYNQLHNVNINNYTPKDREDESKYEMVNYSLSVIIIDLISEFYTMSNVMSKELYNSWILTFKQWFNSESSIIRKTWDSIRSTYSPSIQKFIDSLQN